MAVPGDLRLTVLLWPYLLASALGLVPFTVFATFLVPIAADAGTDVAVVGALRGLAGLTALLVGAALAPLLDRIPPERSAAAALLLLGGAACLGAVGGVVALAVFCLLTGAATAVLGPALALGAAGRLDDDAAARGATLVGATQSLTALLAAPLVAVPALWWGWRGDLVAVLVAAVVLAVVLLRRPVVAAPVGGPRPGHLAAFAALCAVPRAGALIAIAFLRTAAFMGHLSYLAVLHDQRFGLGPGAFALVWTVSGAAFFAGNLITGRLVGRAGAGSRVEGPIAAALVVAAVAVVVVYLADRLPVALAGTAVLAAAQAVVAACVTTGLVRSAGGHRGAALGVAAAAMNLGTFVGAGAAGAGLALGGFPGVAAVLAALTLGALALTRPWVRPAGPPTAARSGRRRHPWRARGRRSPRR